jgi:hypothetical protein
MCYQDSAAEMEAGEVWEHVTFSASPVAAMRQQ